jgi:acylphosphatase
MAIAYRVALLIIVALLGPTELRAKSDKPALQATSGTVSGTVQKVGFRALILKQAIELNLAGSAKNNDDGTVQFTLQGDKKRIGRALTAIGKGTKKSADVKVATSPATIDPALSTFTVIAWTSTSRHITNPYDLVFVLRADDTVISKKKAKDVYHQILKDTVKGDDLNKLGDDNDD